MIREIHQPYTNKHDTRPNTMAAGAGLTHIITWEVSMAASTGSALAPACSCALPV